MAMASCLGCVSVAIKRRNEEVDTVIQKTHFVFFFLSFVDLYFLNRRFMPSLQKK